MQLNPNTLFASRYRLIKQIGIGGFSVVWLAADERAENLECAIKIYAPLDDAGIKQFRKEYTLTANLQHLGLLKATYYDVHDRSPFLVMPFCKNGSLDGLLQDKGNFTEREIAEVLYQVADALEYLHRKEILHQDIKPDNVLINEEGKYLLSDFGISSRMRSALRKSTSSTKALTEAYAPPERFIGSQTSDEKGDVFSLGVMLFELATGYVPWNGKGGVMLNLGGQTPELPIIYSKGLEQLMQSCLQYSPTERPTAAVLKKAAQLYLQDGVWPPIQQKRDRVTDFIPDKPGGRITEPLKPKPAPQVDTPTRPPGPIQEQKAGNKTTLILAVVAVLVIVAGLVWWQPWATNKLDPAREKKFLAIKSQAELLESENRWAEALTKYKEASIILEDTTVQQKITSLEDKLKRGAKVKEEEAWANAKQGKTLSALEQYLDDYPDGQYKDDATRLILALEDQQRRKEQKIINKKNSLLGTLGSNLIMQDINIKPKSMYDIKAKYIILFFFDPYDEICEIQGFALSYFYKMNKDRLNLEVYAVSSDTSIAKMNEYIDRIDAKWVTVNGPRSYLGVYRNKYNIVTLPEIYILDDKKKIIGEDLSVNYLDVFFYELQKN